MLYNHIKWGVRKIFQVGESVPLSGSLHVVLHHPGHCSGPTQDDLSANIPPGDLNIGQIRRQTFYLADWIWLGLTTLLGNFPNCSAPLPPSFLQNSSPQSDKYPSE